MTNAPCSICCGALPFLAMDKLTLLAPAKLNLLLDILGKRPDGYHEVRMVMQSIGWYDVLTFERTNAPGVSFTVTDPEGRSLSEEESGIPLDGRNLVLKAVKLLSAEHGPFDGLSVTLEKHLPSQAGLGGGSSDAAAALTGINRLFGLGLGIEELSAFAVRLGADVPFFLAGGTCLAEGIGERLTKLPPLRLEHILIVKPKASLSTKLVYEYCDSVKDMKHPDLPGFLHALSGKDMLPDTFLSTICETMGNVMEEAAFRICPELAEIKKTLRALGAEQSLMTGSGSAVFGIFRDEETARKAHEYFREQLPEAVLRITGTTEFGVEEMPV